MVVLNKIYTRTGDKGTTALGTGERVAKTDPRIEAYCTVDETNSIIGMARFYLNNETSYDHVNDMLKRIQNDMFDLGADLCIPDRGEKLDFEPLRISDAQVKRLEDEIDTLNKDLKSLRSFILPGGSGAATSLHMARTVSRRAERCMVALSQMENEPVSEASLQYINRLSDFLFVAGRYVNNKGEQDVLWEPGKNH